eukprot:TRINITY_DN11104_c0_g1_i3.p1 TRINITY_DN11104_c0_g1~~TRINITY_DN11104_c0_g1_i3.p1  ORF type:complete len:996 (+),score=235.45 TRINITY_DN11104_c0_g1_i3:83-3070(+)
MSQQHQSPPKEEPREPAPPEYASTKDSWSLVYDKYDEKHAQLREALTTLGNGIFCTRGAEEESHADGTHYPATYFAGGFNRLDSKVGDSKVSNEDLVNFPNWLPLTFRIVEGEKGKEKEGDWFEIKKDGSNLLSYRKQLDLKTGILHRWIKVKDGDKVTTISSKRIVRMHSINPHMGVIEYVITPENWEGQIEIRSSLDGSVENTGIARYSELASKHLKVLAARETDKGILLVATTVTSQFVVGMAASTKVFVDKEEVTDVGRRVLAEQEKVHEICSIKAQKGNPITVEKVVSIYSNHDAGVLEPGEAACALISCLPPLKAMMRTHLLQWASLWEHSDVVLKMKDDKERDVKDSHNHDANHESNHDSTLIQGFNCQLAVRLHIFHLLAVVSLNSLYRDVGVPARGLHGESYRGHIFWDEMFILPFYTLHIPAISQTLIRYRYSRLVRARQMALQEGYKGALFPWQSGSSGCEESQTVHYNPVSKKWDPDNSSLQRHVSLAIAYNILRYYDTTKDTQFMEMYGAELVINICRFWAGLAFLNKDTGRYEIHKIMGPDEFHEKYHGAKEGGLKNNTYTNVMVVWLLLKALFMIKDDHVLRPRYRDDIRATFDIQDDEITLWEDLTRKMTVVFHKDGIWSQFEGYEDLEELDWEGYREKYGSIERLDRILKAEGDSPDKYKLSKQADTCMLFFVLTTKELQKIFQDLGYPFPDDIVQRNIYYYLARTSHGSTLSKLVFSSILQPYDKDFAWDMYIQALRSDIEDTQNGTTGEGIHMAVMAGTINALTNRYAGVDTSRDALHIKPHLPDAIEAVEFSMQFRGVYVDVHVSHTDVSVNAETKKFPVFVRDILMVASDGKPASTKISNGEGHPSSVSSSSPSYESDGEEEHTRAHHEAKLKDKCCHCSLEFEHNTHGHHTCGLCGKKQCTRCGVGKVSIVEMSWLDQIQVCDTCYKENRWNDMHVVCQGQQQSGSKKRSKRVPRASSMERRQLRAQMRESRD